MAREGISTFRWLQGLAVASLFSLVYAFAPIYCLSSIVFLVLRYPCIYAAILYAIPLMVSILIPSRPVFGAANYMTSMLDYFDYEEVLETTNDDCRNLLNKEGKKFILAFQPHGVISFCSLCAWINAPADIRPIPTAVASAVLQFPILKNVMGIFGLTDASSSNVKNILRQKGTGIRGCIVIYVGGIAELFLTCNEKERLYLNKRKGFIKIALREEGVDVIPVYLFGNTSILSVVQTKFLETLSRRMQTSVTPYFWGKWCLPIPRDDKLLYVRGKPLGMPHIPEPTNDDVDKWHAIYVKEVTRLFHENKEKVPAYKHKTLHIV